MAELRSEISDLATKIEAAHAQMQREFLALKAIHEGLKARTEQEVAAQPESDKLAALESKIAALDLQPAEKSKATPQAAPHTKAHT